MADIVFNDFTYLEKYAQVISQSGFWQDVSEQVKKDFNNEVSINPDKENNLQGEQAAEFLVKELEKQLPAFTPRLSEILYRINVSEKQINELKNVPNDMYYRCLAEIILKRIILKVAIRTYYSENKI